MFILADANGSTEKFLDRVHRGVLDQKGGRRRGYSGAAIHVDIAAGTLADGGIAPGDQDLSGVELEQDGVPADIAADDAIRHVALAAAGAIVDDVDDRRLAGFRSTRQDVELAGAEGDFAYFAGAAVKDQLGDLQAHGVIPQAAKIVGVVPAAANHRPSKPARSTHSRASSVNRPVRFSVAACLFDPTAIPLDSVTASPDFSPKYGKKPLFMG